MTKTSKRQHARNGAGRTDDHRIAHARAPPRARHSVTTPIVHWRTSRNPLATSCPFPAGGVRGGAPRGRPIRAGPLPAGQGSAGQPAELTLTSAALPDRQGVALRADFRTSFDSRSRRNDTATKGLIVTYTNDRTAHTRTLEPADIAVIQIDPRRSYWLVATRHASHNQNGRR